MILNILRTELMHQTQFPCPVITPNPASGLHDLAGLRLNTLEFQDYLRDGVVMLDKELPLAIWGWFDSVSNPKHCLRWTRFFYATSMPSISNNNPEYHWPQLETTLRDHAAMNRESPAMKKDAYGKAFKVSEPLDPAVRRDGFVKCKLSSTKKAGIISNQKASCAAAWLAANHTNDFADAGQAWTGLLTKRQLTLASPFHNPQAPKARTYVENEPVVVYSYICYRAHVSARTTTKPQPSPVFKISETCICTGCFFGAGNLYQNSNTNQVTLCLGFREYGALAVVLKEVKAGDKDT